MALDVRRITFSTEEILHALEIYRADNPDYLPAGRIVAAVPGKEHALVISIESSDNGVTTKTPVHLESFDVLKALIRFCIDNKIMLPRTGQKSFAITPEGASLNIRFDISVKLSREPYLPVLNIKNLPPLTKATATTH